MYDENPSFLRSSGHHIPEFPTKQIETPIGIFYGGQDTLADLGYLLSKSPDPVFCLKVDGKPLLLLLLLLLLLKE